MNEAKAKLDAGDLSGAIQSALNIVRSNPTDKTARTMLFELSCFSGEWERAVKQLDVIGQQDAEAMIGTLIFRQNLGAEKDRIRTFAEGLIPECLMPPPKYVEDLIVASTHLREGRGPEARKLLDEVEEARPAFPCKVNGEEVGDFRDYNDLTSCFFEAIVKDSYTWIPFEQVSSIKFFEPKSLRDLYWTQVEIEMTNGTGGEMFVPALYVNSHESDDDQIRLGHVTDWRDAGDDVYIGEGMRIFAVGSGYKAISDIKEIEFLHESDS
jgi:type VI secretion system protein ImpE